MTIEFVARFKLTFASDGRLATLHIKKPEGWASVPITNANHALTQEWKDWESKNQVLNLSDRPPTPEVPQLDWKKFRRGMWSNAGFKRLTKDTSDRESKEDLKIAAAVGTDDFVWIKSLWDACVDGLATKPTTAEIDAWKAIAANAAMPLSFGADGKMIL